MARKLTAAECKDLVALRLITDTGGPVTAGRVDAVAGRATRQRLARRGQIGPHAEYTDCVSLTWDGTDYLAVLEERAPDGPASLAVRLGREHGSDGGPPLASIEQGEDEQLWPALGITSAVTDDNAAERYRMLWAYCEAYDQAAETARRAATTSTELAAKVAASPEFSGDTGAYFDEVAARYGADRTGTAWIQAALKIDQDKITV